MVDKSATAAAVSKAQTNNDSYPIDYPELRNALVRARCAMDAASDLSGVKCDIDMQFAFFQNFPQEFFPLPCGHSFKF